MIGVIVTRRLISESRNLSEKETTETLELITSDVLNPTLEEFTSSETLRKLKETALKRYSYPFSPPRLSAYVVSAIAMELISVTAENFKSCELPLIPPLDICMYDIAVGMLKTVSVIDDAEDKIRGTLRDELGNLLSQYTAGRLNPSDEIDFLFAENVEALNGSKILTRDPTGKDLIRRVVEEIENPQGEFSPCLKESVMHGAKFAQKAYEAVYPLAEKISKLS